MKLEYLKFQLGFDLLLKINDKIFYENELSLVNSPLTCISTPFLKMGASLCIRLHDMEIKDGLFKGCINIDAFLNKINIAELQIACFSIENNHHKEDGYISRLKHFFKHLLK